MVSPVRTVLRLISLMGEAAFWQAVGVTFGHILLGFLLGAVSGALLAALSGWRREARILFSPLMRVVKATPVASFVILALIFIRSRNLSVFISFLMVLPIMYTNILTGIDGADPKMLQMAKVFRMSRARTAASVYLTAVYPHFLAACGLALGMCWKAGVAAEVIAVARPSIGAELYLAKLNFATADIFAWTLAVVLLSLIFERAMLWATRLLRRAFEGE